MMRLPVLARPAPRRAARAARPHRRCSVSPTRCAMLAVAQLPGLPSRADGSLVDARPAAPVGSRLIGQSFTDADGNPLAAVLPDPAVGGRRRLRPDRDRRLQPRPGERRRHPRRPTRERRRRPSLLTQVCARSLAVGDARRRRRQPPVLHRRRRRRGPRGVPRRRAHRPGHPGRSASTRPARPRRSWPPTRACRVECATPGEDYSPAAVDHPDPRRRPGRPGGPGRRGHRQRQRPRPAHQPGVRATCRSPGSPGSAASTADAGAARWSTSTPPSRALGLPRRADGQRARAQPRPGRPATPSAARRHRPAPSRRG